MCENVLESKAGTLFRPTREPTLVLVNLFSKMVAFFSFLDSYFFSSKEKLPPIDPVSKTQYEVKLLDSVIPR